MSLSLYIIVDIWFDSDTARREDFGTRAYEETEIYLGRNSQKKARRKRDYGDCRCSYGRA